MDYIAKQKNQTPGCAMCVRAVATVAKEEETLPNQTLTHVTCIGQPGHRMHLPYFQLQAEDGAVVPGDGQVLALPGAQDGPLLPAALHQLVQRHQP